MANHEEDVQYFCKIVELRYRLDSDTNERCDDGFGGVLPDIANKLTGQYWPPEKEIQYLEESCVWEEAPEKTVAEILGGQLEIVNEHEASDAEVKSSLKKILLLLKEHGVEIEIECVKGPHADECSGAPVLFLQTQEISASAYEEPSFTAIKTQIASSETQVAVKLNSSTFKVLSPEEIRKMYSKIISDILPERMKDMSELHNPVQTWLVDVEL